MSYEDDIFYQIGKEFDLQSHIIAKYFVTADADKLDLVLKEIPAESSVGTWQRVQTVTEDILKRLAASTFEVEKLSPSAAILKVAYPIELFEEGNIAQMLSLVAGNIYGMNTLKTLRLLDVIFPDKFMRSFPGPEFGVQGIYKTLNVEKGPILGSIIKPKLGLPPKEHAKVAYETWAGGITWIKDDEPMTNQSFCPFDERISNVLEMADRIKEEQGRQVIYASNITGTVSQMLERADFVKDHGGKCLMIDVLTTGFEAVQHIRESGFNLPIHAHRAMHAAITRHPEHGIDMSVLAKVFRLIGVDAIHTGTIFGKMGYGELKEDKKEVLTSNQALLNNEYGGLKPVMPIASGGVGVKNIGKIIQALAPNVIITAGGGIHGHPDGSFSGAKSLTQAAEAAKLDIVEPEELLKWAVENNKSELIRALKG